MDWTLQYAATQKAMAQINDTTRAVSIDTLQHTATQCIIHCTHCNTLQHKKAISHINEACHI